MRSGRMKRSERAAVVEDVNAAPRTTTTTVEVATAAATTAGASVAGRNYFLMQLKVCIPLVVNKTPSRGRPSQAGADQARPRRAPSRPQRKFSQFSTTQRRLIGIWSCCCCCSWVCVGDWVNDNDMTWPDLACLEDFKLQQRQQQRQLHLPLWMNAGEIALDRREYMRSYNSSSSKKWQEGIDDWGDGAEQEPEQALWSTGIVTPSSAIVWRCQNRFRVREPKLLQLQGACLHVSQARKCNPTCYGGGCGCGCGCVCFSDSDSNSCGWLCTCRRFCSAAAAFEKCHILRVGQKNWPTERQRETRKSNCSMSNCIACQRQVAPLMTLFLLHASSAPARATKFK